MASFGAQRGNTFVGFILGLIVGLTIALVVAIYVTKVPIPFLNKGLSRNAEQDAAEEKKNKDWDPNAPLYGKTPSSPKPTDPPAAQPVTPQAPVTAPAASSDPLGDLANSKAGAVEEFQYLVQVGAYHASDEAESQRAKLALSGYDPKISERDQAGKMVYRVRLGPFESKTEAEQIQAKLKATKVESALIRVQR
ncbi:FtsN Cell division protein [Burkholderiaceae bacterium]|jgi:cell division protein FtsN